MEHPQSLRPESLKRVAMAIVVTGQLLYGRRCPDGSGDNYNPSLYGLGLKCTHYITLNLELP